MKKLAALRAHLLAAVPGLARNPDRVLTFVESGRVEFHRGPSLSHGYTIPAQIVLTDYSGEIDAVILPLLHWLSIHEPDLDPAEAVRFDAEILDNNSWDLALTVTLTERVVATLDTATGHIHSQHRMPAYPDPADRPAQWRVYATAPGDEQPRQIAEWADTPTAAESAFNDCPGSP